MRKFKLMLRFFDEGGAESAAVSAEPAGDAAGTAAEEHTEPAAPERPSFRDLIKGDYKQEADEYIQKLVQNRIKDSKADKATIAAQADILSVVASKYGMDLSDLNALKEKVSNDDAYYEERAVEEGLTVDQYKRIAQAEAKGRQYEAMVAQMEQERAAREQVSLWQEQAAKLKETFPEFDLSTEMQNETFQKQLRLGIDMQSAYVAAHQAQILQGAMQYTAQQVRKATADDIAARGSRPKESVSGNQASAGVHKDVSKLTRADREELSRRAMAGEMISFT